MNSNKSIQADAVAVNLEALQSFKAGEIVSPKNLADKGLIQKVSGMYPKVKILSVGEVTAALTIRDCTVSAGAKAKIEKAGGKIAA